MTTHQAPARALPVRPRRLERACWLLALCAVCVAAWTLVGTGAAAAAPSLSVELTRDEAVWPVIHRNDERLDYTATVTNTASSSTGVVSVGDTLTCRPDNPSGNWLPAAGQAVNPALTYEWRRDGVVIPGQSSSTYVVSAPGDVGKAIQCVVAGANVNATTKFASLNPVVVDPLTIAADPRAASRTLAASRPTVSGSGTASRTCAVPTNWEAPAGVPFTNPADFAFKWLRNGTPIAGQTTSSYTPQTATATATRSLLATGSGDRSLLASGTATRTIGTRVLTGVTNVAAFSVGESISGGGIPEGATIVAIDIGAATITISKTVATTGSVSPLVSGSRTLTNVTGSFTVGESIIGTGIPNGTTIAAVGAGTLTLSAGVASAGAATALTSGSRVLTGFSPAGTFAVGDAITGTGIAPGARVVAVDTGAGTLTLDTGVTTAGASGAISGGIDNGIVLQCEVIGTVPSGGSTLGISNNSAVNVGAVPSNVVVGTPMIDDPNNTSGPVTVEIELPPGAEIYKVYSPPSNPLVSSLPTLMPNGWSCSQVAPFGGESAKVVCTRSNALSPGASYPPFSVAARLTPEAPDTATATATVSGGGTASPFDSLLSFDFAPAQEFAVKEFETFVRDQADDPYTQAGGHPYKVGERFEFTGKRLLRDALGSVVAKRTTIENFKTSLTETPRGFVGSARAVENLCPSVLEVQRGTCPLDSVVGGMIVTFATGDNLGTEEKKLTIYAVEPERGRVAQFGAWINFIKTAAVFYPRLRADDGYAVTIESAPSPRGVPRVIAVDAELCGFGAQAVIDTDGTLRATGCKAAGAPDPDGGGGLTAALERPLVTLPPRCADTPPTTVFRADSWESPGVFKSASFTDPALTGCELVQFDPEIEFEPTSTAADSASGLDVELSMPPEGIEDPEGVSQAHLKKTVVELPEGLSVNPSAATGLEGCSDAQLGLGSDAEPSCPDGSKIASVEVTTPVLEETLTGSMVLRTPESTDPMSGEMLRMALIVRNDERGLLVKLPGSATADPQTGKITATFDENPELPIGTVEVHLKGGLRGVLAMPQDCGERSIDTELSPWKGDLNTNAIAQDFADGFAVGGDCSNGFAPALDAGTDTQAARASGKFSFKFTRKDGEQWLRGLTARLPKGLLASVKDLPLCTNAQADAGDCPTASRIGRVDAKAGSGDPFVLEQKGDVYLTEGYKGGVYGLAVKIRAIAGPFRGEHELSPIIVRQAIHVDRSTAQVSAVSDPFPLIHHGVPLRTREVTVVVDRDGFMLNPSSCAGKQVGADILSAEGASAGVANHFQAVNCANLPYRPKLALRLTGRRQVTTGKHPGIRAVVTQKGVSEAGIEKADVRLPKSLALDVDNAQALCEFDDGTKPDLENHCPKGSIVGRARATSPLLNDPLVGNVYFVKNIRIDRKTGNQIRTLPMIIVALRGEIAVNLKGESDTTSAGRLVNTFDNVPDAPVSQFNLNINGGKTGILAVTRTRRSLINLCAGRHIAEADMDGHNGRRHDFDIRMKTPCTKRQTKAAKRKAKRAAAKVGRADH